MGHAPSCFMFMSTLSLSFRFVVCFHFRFGLPVEWFTRFTWFMHFLKKISQENLCFFLLVFFCRVFSFCSAWPSPFDKGQGWAERQHICLIIYLITRQHDALLLLPRLHLAAATVAVRARAKGKAKAATTTFHRSACQGCVRILSCA